MTDESPATSPLDEPHADPTDSQRLAAAAERALAGNVAKVGDKLEKQGKLFVRFLVCHLKLPIV